MQQATAQTVLGDFDGATYTYAGVTSTFSRRDGTFFVHTDGPGGEMGVYRIAYTFGIEPLQQYLIEFPDGRLQALSICWDTRPAAEGGQRWFHLYPNEVIRHDDPRHWTGRQQNWNFMCAECHSTNLEKNYDLGADRYATTWSEIDVSCEACHGPGSRHVAWAEASERGQAAGGSHDMGLRVRLKDVDGGAWIFDEPTTGIARRSVPRSSQAQLETCGRCHSRRSVSAANYTHGRPLADSHRLALLDEGLYHADGQILDEVYVYGSFVQSAMHRAGVTCSDCHDPHSAALPAADPDASCFRCHQAERFASIDHHFHPQGSAGASCVECHMPSRTYMGVDRRRDHGFRVPRPEWTVELGTPNACNDCHQEESAEWAVMAVERWYGSGLGSAPEHARAIAAGRGGDPDAESALAAVMNAAEAPGIVRATATSLIGRYLSPTSLPALERSLSDGDPLVRAAAVRNLEILPPEERLELAADLLLDPIRLVRIDAARVLADVPESWLSPGQSSAREAALSEYRQEQMAAAEGPEAHTNLGTLAAALGDLDAAEAALRQALEIDSGYLPAYVNLADLLRVREQELDAEAVLRRGLKIVPGAAALHQALGLALIRQGRGKEALTELRLAAELAPSHSRYAYVFGVALHSAGETDRALAVLDAAHRRAPGDRSLLQALATISRDRGARAEALEYARRLLLLSPQDPTAQQLVADLEQAENRPGGGAR